MDLPIFLSQNHVYLLFAALSCRLGSNNGFLQTISCRAYLT